MKQVAKGIISVSFLSKFERGESEISISSFVQILARLSVTFDECQYIYRDYGSEPLEDFFAEMRKAYERRDLDKLNHLKKQELQKWESYQLAPYRCNALALEVFKNMIKDQAIDDVDKEALTILYDYLFRVEVWGYYELMLYNTTILLMPTEMVVTLSKTLPSKKVTDINR